MYLAHILVRLLTSPALSMILDVTALSMFVALILKLPRFKFCSDQNLSYLSYEISPSRLN